jgi:putative addiction module CopG family antidote
VKKKTRSVSVSLGPREVEMLDHMVRAGLYVSKSEAVRAAIRELARRVLHNAK